MLLDRYKGKVVAREVLKSLLASTKLSANTPRKVVMCNGVFDLVHPGHIRHLLYAKSKADILVVCITADRFIKKGIYRPHVTEDLRALNLAALEMVDYVVIDQSDRPDETICYLQPDIYAKGFEYSSTMRGGRSISEEDAVHSYGGEVIYSPGDLVMSSTALLKHDQPDLRYEKLSLVMDSFGLTFDKLRAKVRQMHQYGVKVVGDTIVDTLTYCSMIGGQTKTPTISALYDHHTNFVGGAAVVAKHLAATGADVSLATVIGDDKLGLFVLEDLKEHGVSVSHFIEPSRPTTNKNAFVIGDYRMLKVDTLDNRSISDETLGGLINDIANVNEHSIIFSDFRHGVFNRRTIEELISATMDYRFRVADSQVASRWGNILDFQGFDLITPNEREARFALGDQDSGIRPLTALLYERAKCKAVIMKLGARGIMAANGVDAPDESWIIDSFADHVVDPVGAGDALLAYATLSMLQDGDLVSASILGSFAAGIECEYEGNIPVGPEAVMSKIDDVEGKVS